MIPERAVVILSGGIDSSLCAYIAKSKGLEIITVHFNYGQRTQNKELESFRNISSSLQVEKRYEINIDFFKQIGASALTDNNFDVPINGIEPGIPITYVPYRNGIFLSIATAIAEKERANFLYIGVVQEDSSGYPDCKEEFIKAQENAIDLGTKPTTNIKIVAPLIHLKKEDIVKEAIRYKLPIELTWSCYKNEDIACGVCDSCRFRLKGFKKAGFEDKIKYLN